ncbi:hypothetical protein CcrMagneto_gp284 [Caulobacter virus Magneto]|uniref:hypothetical protein n=1 Tax=Caulobacter virus Magneto TaxID=1211642 RepID=UPI00028AD840|nr:hypothetical protein CcrMagneto_gp284 [Caulobacter virus Magneto]AFU87454.1 hypothetical protein CcrMagneto_gp284 [Caulobacter virus Magneto]
MPYPIQIDPIILALGSAWKAADALALDLRHKWSCATNDRSAYEAWKVADDVRNAAFKAMTYALPDPGKPVFISPTDWLADKDNWRTEYAPVRVWNGADHYKDWYPCLGHYEFNVRTGERFYRGAEMFDRCVEEAARRNAEYAAYYAKQAA